MCAKKTPPPKPGITAAIVLASSRARWVIVIAIFLAILGVGWSLAWNRVKDHVLTDKDYRLSAKEIVTTPPPAWIHADVKTEVIRDASLDGTLSILDDDLTKRIANAFSLHPWVEKVVRVSKHHPARVEVELSYRQPMAMIEVSGGLLPVDGEGILLPSEDFSPAAAKKYPRVARIDSHPAGPIGTPWGDVHVTGAAQIAKAIGDRWHTLRLYRVMAPVRAVNRDVDGYTYELTTHPGTRIIWGRPPGSEPTGEPPALDKIARLEKIAAEAGTLEGATGPQVIDLRDASAPRTAIKPMPTGEAQ